MDESLLLNATDDTVEHIGLQAPVQDYSGSEERAHSFRGGVNPTIPPQSTDNGTAGYSTLPNPHR
jgi:hypothetical protein